MEILETTLRDGSYPIKFGFTVKDTALICSGLEMAGFNLIEIGHGVGLGASESGHGKAAETDEEYLKAANAVLKKAKFGMFYIPGIAQLKHISLAAKHNMGFIRIGTNATEVEKGEEAIKLAKSHGMMVFANLMKSYAIPPKELLIKAKKAQDYGAEVIVLVDSAGGMIPETVKEYIKVLKEGLNVKIGFHGHNNLQLAIANSLAAIEAGADIIDTSLLGLGRSAGNTPTELLLLILKRKGINLGIDINSSLDLGYKFVAPYLMNSQLNPLTPIAGYAEFHSSFLKKVYAAAKTHSLNPRDIILEATKIDKINLSDQVLETVINVLNNQGKKPNKLFPSNPLEEKQVSFSIEEDLAKSLSDLKNISSKFNKKTVFTIVLTEKPHDPTVILPFVIESTEFVVGSAEVFKNSQMDYIIKMIDGEVDYILIDSKVLPETKKTKVLRFNQLDVLTSTGATLVFDLCKEKCKALIIGDNSLAKGLKIKLEMQDYLVLNYPGEKELFELVNEADIIIGCSRHKSIGRFTLTQNKIVIDLGIGTFDDTTVKSILKTKSLFYRANTADALIGEIKRITATNQHLTKNSGKAIINEVPVVGAGMMGEEGDVIVDSISNPKKVIGIADGTGHVIYGNSKWDLRKQKINEHIYKKQLGEINSDERIFE